MYILNEVRKGTHSFAAMLHAILLNHCMCAAIERLEYLQVHGWVHGWVYLREVSLVK